MMSPGGSPVNALLSTIEGISWFTCPAVGRIIKGQATETTRTTQALCDLANDLNAKLGYPGTYTPKGRRKAGMKTVVAMLQRDLAEKEGSK